MEKLTHYQLSLFSEILLLKVISDFRGRTENDKYWYGMKQLDFLRNAKIKRNL